MTQSHTILRIIKRLLLQRQITYSQLAKNLKVSEISVKRMLNGNTSMSIDRLEKIFKLLGIDFLDLAQLLTTETDKLTNQLTERQEMQLAQNGKLLAFLYLLMKGYNFKQICQRYDYTENEALLFANKLEKLKILELHPNNHVKLLVSKMVQWRKQGPLEKKFRADHQAHFLGGTFDGPNDIIHFLTVLLPERTLHDFKHQFVRLIEEMRETSSMKEVRDPNLSRPFTLLLAGRDFVPPFIEKYRRK